MSILEKSNYSRNRAFVAPRGLINGQAIQRCGKMRFGIRSVASVGSAVIAIYNLMLLLGREPVLAEIARELYIRAGTPLGLFGVRPHRLFRYFSSHYIPVNLDRNFDSFCEKFTPGNCGIIVCKTRKGIFSVPHFMAIENDRGKILIYNRFPASGKAYQFSSPAFAANKKDFIVGYFIQSEQ